MSKIDELAESIAKKLRKDMMQEIREIVRSEFKIMLNEINQPSQQPQARSVESERHYNPKTKPPVLSSNASLQSLLEDTFIRSNGGNEHIPVEGSVDNYYAPGPSSPRNDVRQEFLTSMTGKGLTLNEAIPDYAGEGGGESGLRPSGNVAAIIQNSPGLAHALTRDYSQLMKHINKKKRANG